MKPCLWGAAVGVGDVEISEPISVHTPVQNPSRSKHPPPEGKSVLVFPPLLHLFSGLDSLTHGSGAKGPLLRPDDGALSPC